MDDNLRARHAKKRKDQKLSLENDRVTELNTIKHDGAFKGLAGQLNESNAAYDISAYAVQDDNLRAEHESMGRTKN